MGKKPCSLLWHRGSFFEDLSLSSPHTLPLIFQSRDPESARPFHGSEPLPSGCLPPGKLLQILQDMSFRMCHLFCDTSLSLKGNDILFCAPENSFPTKVNLTENGANFVCRFLFPVGRDHFYSSWWMQHLVWCFDLCRGSISFLILLLNNGIHIGIVINY